MVAGLSYLGDVRHWFWRVWLEASLQLQRELSYFIDPLNTFVAQMASQPLPPDWRKQLHDYLDAWEPDGYEVAPEHRPILEDFILMWANARANVTAAKPRPTGAIPREPLDMTDERRRFYEQEVKDSIARDHEFTPQGSRFERAAREAEPVEPPAPHVVSEVELKGLGGRYDEAVASGQYKPGFFTRVAVNVARGVFVGSEPTKIVTYSDGTIYIQLGGGPSAGAMAGQAGTVTSVFNAARAGQVVREVFEEVADAAFQEATDAPIGASTLQSFKPGIGMPRIFWKKISYFENYKVYQRDDLIDPKRIGKEGQTSLELMKDGRPPIGPDGSELQLHHINQANTGPLAEITTSFARKYIRVIHIDLRQQSEINRAKFNNERGRYWIQRAKDFEDTP